MTKRRTAAQKRQDCFDVFKCIQEGKRVKRSISKDGSIPTNSVVEVTPSLPEADVLRQCLDWFKEHGILANRHDAGTFQNNRGQWGSYGIKHAGDIIGCLKNGQHFEIECKKSSGGRLSLGQQKRQELVRASCGFYFVIHGVAELEHYFWGVDGI